MMYVFLNRCVNEKEARILLKKIRAYTMFVLDSVELNGWTKWFMLLGWLNT